MNIYIAASWKHQHAVEMLTELLRAEGHTIFSFVENNHGEQQGHLATIDGKPIIGLYSKGEDFGLMRRMIHWLFDYRSLISTVRDVQKGIDSNRSKAAA